ncbi:flagellar export chaperone FliS [Desulfoluna spongiiphila]|uniref:Flagellar secretion chaperone FliS n=1 Tax=Desulfoluna spongiiphila TaxID=419481 RepID=A0A1G5F0W1_9BACT|nr:flagellar export chaperone FliS [Desulfoluna spongiiphila]SCY32842.1 flagellar protein FliS [Desulfoluna spongiiphila]
MTPMTYSAYAASAAREDLPQDRILVMLYEGAIKFIHLAVRGIDEKRPALKGEYISKVLAILTELSAALDMERGGEIAENLAALYDYMVRRLTEANIKNDTAALREVETLIVSLKEGFAEASRIRRQSSVRQPEKPRESCGVCVAI